MGDTLAISDAARRCGMARRTLQRAIQAGRLRVTPDHRLTLDALRQAGYVPATSPQGTPQPTSHATPPRLSQDLAPIVTRLDRLIAVVERLCDTLAPQPTAAT